MANHPRMPDSLPAAWVVSAVGGFAGSVWFFPVVLAATVAGLFFDAVGADCVFAYRDALHFYPPLYRLVREEWLSGRVPLWNPLLNCGQPLAGMGTAGAFYPPQVLLTMLLPDGVSLNVYCILHLAFAATGAYVLSRHQSCSRPAATVAGLAYGFCGSVLLQIYNPIYAAGAAWLVWGVYGGLRLLGGGGVRDFLLLAVSLAMSVYCGDPQSGYHVGLVLGLYWLTMPGRSWRGLALLAMAGAAGAMLALVQVAVTAEFMRDTTRAMDVVPLSIWDVPQFLARPAKVRQGVQWYDLFIGRTPVGADQYRTLYGFPLQLHRLGEFFWPGMSGSSFGRWTVSAGLASPDWWVASLYAGSVTALASMIGMMRGHRDRVSQTWRLVLLLAILAGLGSCGLVGMTRWLIQAFTGRGLAHHYQPGDEVGGLYWLLATFAPGYAGFRYPVKWMTVAALAAGQLAASVMDSLDAADVRRSMKRLAMCVAAVQVVASVALIAAYGFNRLDFWPEDLSQPRQADGFWRVVAGGMHGAIAAAGVAVAAGWMRGGSAVSLRVVMTALLAVDLAIANRPDILVAPWSAVTAGLASFASLAHERPLAAASGGAHFRIHRLAGSTFVEEFSQSLPDKVRQTAVCLTGNLPWIIGCGLVGDGGTAISRDNEVLRTARIESGKTVVPRRFFDLASTEFFVITNLATEVAASEALRRDWTEAQRVGVYAGLAPIGGDLPAFGVAFDDEHPDPPLVFVCRNDSVLPRARIIHEFAIVPPLTADQRDRWLKMLERVAFPADDMPNLRSVAIIEADDAALFVPASAQLSPAGTPPKSDRCTMIIDEPQRVVIDADLAEPGFLYLADSFHADWTAAVATAGARPRLTQTVRANRVHRAVQLPAGSHRVEFRYQSRTFSRTAAATVTAWIIATGVFVWSRRRSRPARGAGAAS